MALGTLAHALMHEKRRAGMQLENAIAAMLRTLTPTVKAVVTSLTTNAATFATDGAALVTALTTAVVDGALITQAQALVDEIAAAETARIAQAQAIVDAITADALTLSTPVVAP